MKQKISLVIACIMLFSTSLFSQFTGNKASYKHTLNGNLNVLVIPISYTVSNNYPHSKWPWPTSPTRHEDCLSTELKPYDPVDSPRPLFYENNSEFTNPEDPIKDSWNLSRLYNELSQGQFNLTATVFPRVIELNGTGWNRTAAEKEALNQIAQWDFDADYKINGIFKDQYNGNLEQWVDFNEVDQRENAPPNNVDNSTSSPDGKIDYIVFYHRLNRNWWSDPTLVASGLPFNSFGLGDASASAITHVPNYTYNGNNQCYEYQSMSSYSFEIRGGILFELFPHEFAHSNNNSAHVWGQNGVVGDYFESYQYSNSVMKIVWTAPNKSFNAFERYYMGWIPLDAKDKYMSPVSGKIDSKNDLPEDGIFILDDFITSGNALRIKLPIEVWNPGSGGINDLTESYLWIQNHARKSTFDDPYSEGRDPLSMWQGYDNEITSAFAKDNNHGLQMFITSGNGDEAMNPVSDKYMNNEHPLSADGNYDISLIDVHSDSNPYLWTGSKRVYQKMESNPVSGTHIGMNNRRDLNGDGTIKHVSYFNHGAGSEGDQVLFLTDNGIPSNYTRNLGVLGVGHYFNQVGQKVGMGTNPTLVTKAPYEGNNDNVLPNLQGISVKILEVWGDRRIKIQVTYDDVDIENDYRIAGRVQLSNITNSPGVDMRIKDGVTVTIDRSGTNSQENIDPSTGLFNSPTLLRVAPEARIHQEQNSTVDVKEKSTILMEAYSTYNLLSGSELILSDDSELVLKDKSSLYVQDGAIVYVRSSAKIQADNGSRIVVKGTGKIIIECDGFLDVAAGSWIKLENIESSIYLEDAASAITSSGVDIQNMSDNNNGLGTVYIDQTFMNSNISSTLNGTSESVYDQCEDIFFQLENSINANNHFFALYRLNSTGNWDYIEYAGWQGSLNSNPNLRNIYNTIFSPGKYKIQHAVSTDCNNWTAEYIEFEVLNEMEILHYCQKFDLCNSGQGTLAEVGVGSICNANNVDFIEYTMPNSTGSTSQIADQFPYWAQYCSTDGSFPITATIHFIDGSTYSIQDFFNCEQQWNTGFGFKSAESFEDPLKEGAEYTYNAKIFPNPTSEKSTLQYSLEEEKNQVKIELMDGAGKLIQVLDQTMGRSAGEYRQEINLSNLEYGIYFVALTVNQNTQTIKLVKSK
ncbi:MAG: T9SS type A sorting domain-containing protein [Crocinitomicaceae bacterium]|nr:T9SS type A sorting domain-containing protein [Crocinitomicaceae bacterium]